MNNTKRAAKVAASPKTKANVLVNEMAKYHLVKEMDKHLQNLEVIALEPDVNRRAQKLDNYLHDNKFMPVLVAPPNKSSLYVELLTCYLAHEQILLSTEDNSICAYYGDEIVYHKKISSTLESVLDVHCCWMCINNPQTSEEQRAYLKKMLNIQD